MCGSGFSPTSFAARRLAARRYTGRVSRDSRFSRPDRRGLRRYQRGWVGLVVILLALVIVAWLAKSALTSYGERKWGQTRLSVPSTRESGVRLDFLSHQPNSRV